MKNTFGISDSSNLQVDSTADQLQSLGKCPRKRQTISDLCHCRGPKKSVLSAFNVFGSRIDSFVRIIIYFLVFILITCDYNELYSQNDEGLINNNENRSPYLFNLFKSSRKRFGAVACLEKICGEFVSGESQNTKGVFKYDASTLKRSMTNNESFICQYKFIAKKNEKVLITFQKFEVKSVAPDCINEYVDIYIELTNDKIDSYVETNFLSRWCGWKKPDILVSLENVIVIAYHKDWLDRGSSFFGTYEFIDAEPHNRGRIKDKPCEYEFISITSKSGIITSPTYPGTYPSILNCKYKFFGLPNERVSLYFEQILIHYEADHCPYDAIRIFDFQKVSSSTSVRKVTALNRILIDTFCGQKSDLRVYSTNNKFEFEFEMSDSLSNDQYSDIKNQILLRKGFKMRYEFSDSYADLSFITGTHITGTNCDQRIRSKEQAGIIYSPNYFRPNPINVTCRYIFQGLDDHYNFESIRLNFLESNLRPATSNNICNEKIVSYFAVYDTIRDQKIDEGSKYCFIHLGKNDLRSIDSEMVLEYNSQNVDSFNPTNFKANYTFFSEFGIMGTRVYQNRTCLYTYNSDAMAHGIVNSPRYPNNYPLNIMCIYLFNINPDERILVTFNEFRLPNWNEDCTPYEDSLSIHQTKTKELSSSNQYNPQQTHHLEKDWTMVDRYCGVKVPAPFITSKNQQQMKFTFFSDNVNYAQGFEFNYDYVRLPECVYNYYTTRNNTSGQILISNNIKATYYCDWYITTDIDKNILLNFINTGLEDFKRNQFIIRIYDLGRFSLDGQYVEGNDDAMVNLKPKHVYYLDQSVKSFEINSSRIRIQLVVGKNMLMERGQLQINWIAASKNICRKDEFMCQSDGYCIKKYLYCDKTVHCLDGSDETEDCDKVKTEKKYFPFTEIMALIGLVVVIIILMSFCIHCRIQTNKKTNEINSKNSHINRAPVFYRYSPAESIDYLEAAITSV